MLKVISFSLLLILTTSASNDTFKEDQLKFPRVRQAYAEKEDAVLELLSQNELDINSLQLYLRAFKKEKELELWARDRERGFILLKNYKICRTSGSLGPKRRQGDMQIPEGYYHIDRFNPHSNFYLSLGINYPNRSDKILADPSRPGGDIFIHGACVTIGCLPIRDNWIKELYVLCVEARNNGQDEIPLTIFPTKLSDQAYDKLVSEHRPDSDVKGLWEDLKVGYDLFNSTRKLPDVKFLDTGRHIVK